MDDEHRLHCRSNPSGSEHSTPRVIQVELTENGHDRARQVAADTMQATAQITASLTNHQSDEITGAIRHLLAGYDQYVAKAGERRFARPPA